MTGYQSLKCSWKSNTDGPKINSLLCGCACEDRGNMILTSKQRTVKSQIEKISTLLGVDPAWAVAVAYVESSLGLHQKSPTGCRGAFQMSTIAMKDLLLEMEKVDDDWIDICCGVLFLRLLLKRHGSIEAATAKYCDPKDRSFYVDRVLKTMEDDG